MAKVFKILQEHPLIENLPSTSTEFSSFTPSTGIEKRNIDSSSQSQSLSSTTTKHPKMFFIPLERNGKKKARSVDMKYKKTNMKNISPLTEINLVNGEFSTKSYAESFQNKWFHKRFKFRRFNNHNGGNNRIWRQSLGHSYDPENNPERIPFSKPIKHEKKRKSHKLPIKNINFDGNKEIFSAFDNIRENFKIAYTSGNNSQKHYDISNEKKNIGKYPRYSIELQAFKSDKADNFFNYFISSTENSAKVYDVKEEIHKKISKHISSTTAPFYFNKIIKTQKFEKSPKDHIRINSHSTSTETNDLSTEGKSKRNYIEGIDFQQVENINHSMEGDSFSNELLNYIQSHFILVVSILVISITLIIVLGIVTLCIGRKHDGNKKSARKFSPAGIQSFDLPARPDFDYDDIKPKAGPLKSSNETTREKDDGKSMFSIGSQSSMSDVNSKHLVPFARLKNTERWNRELSGLERSARNSTDPTNRNRFGSKPGERLLKLHRNFSSRSSMLQSSSSQQSAKSSPIQRREELENFSRNRAKTRSKYNSPVVQKAKCIKSVSPKTPSNPFEEVEETVVKELQDIIESPECPPDMPPPVESKLTCVNRLLANRPSSFNVSPIEKPAVNSIKPQNGASKNTDKLSNDLRKNNLSLEEFSGDEPGIDY
ncbi:hypothetical protein HNY73_009163 [Argiope bruennichi]|uniref:Uncharacterized protein n=1 Tax=Argiope bruennichi TaxID=94029 RepID=A0A8T0FB47_ARGBR|nr:hypothetical protein HNY73_009163 [Argiope bruennichi]